MKLINDKEYMSWEDFTFYITDLSRQLENSNLFITNIYAIPRGGLTVGVVLSHLLNKELIVDIQQIDSNTLIVDDITDTGITMEKLSTYLVKRNIHCYYASLVHVNSSRFIPDFTVYPRKADWIVFPWEMTK